MSRTGRGTIGVTGSTPAASAKSSAGARSGTGDRRWITQSTGTSPIQIGGKQFATETPDSRSSTTASTPIDWSESEQGVGRKNRGQAAGQCTAWPCQGDHE